MTYFENLFESLGLHWTAAWATSARIAAILLAAWILSSLLQRVIRVFRERLTRRMGEREQVQRAETIGRVLRYVVAVVVTAITVMLVLAEIGVSVAPILGAAGVVGLAVGFGAQSLVKDYFNGFFILLEDQIRQGDVVNIASIGGFVEEVTLRYVRLRDYDGNVHFIPNSLISTVTNMSRGFAQSVMDVNIAYRSDIDATVQIMREVAEGMRADETFGPKILEDLEVAGVERWTETGVVIRARFKVLPLEQWNVRRQYLWRLKKALDAQGIVIAHPHLTVYAGSGGEGRSGAGLAPAVEGVAAVR